MEFLCGCQHCLRRSKPDDIKDLIATKQEDAVCHWMMLKTFYSFSQDNVAIVLVEYNYGTNIDTAYINLKKAIDGIKSDLLMTQMSKYHGNGYELPAVITWL